MKIIIFSFHKLYPSLLKDGGLFSKSPEVISFLLGRLVFNLSEALTPLVEQVIPSPKGGSKVILKIHN